MKVAVFLFLLMHLLSTNGLQLSEDGFLPHQLSNTSLELPSYEIAEGNNLTLQWRSPDLMDLSTLHINCYLKADPERMLIYMVGGVQKYQEEGKLSGRVQCDREALKQGQVRLLLTQLTPLDSGEYQCEMAANYDPDKDWAFLATKHFKLLVTSISLVSTTTLQVYSLSPSEQLLPPRPLKLLAGAKLRNDLRAMVPVSSVRTSSHTVIENYNNSVVVTCTAEGTSPTFSWFNGSTQIIGDGYRIHVAQTGNSSTLTISPIYRFDLASPTFCEASNAISKARSEEFSLVVSLKDSVTIFPEAPPAFVASQLNFSLTCSSPSEPVTNHTWYLDGTELETSGPVLTVKDIEKEGLGSTRSLYTCNATSQTTGKNLISMPVVFTIIESISGVMLISEVYGKSFANLSCLATKGSMQTFKWLKDRRVLSSDDRVVIAADMRSVQINPLQKEDNGEYTCEVSNPVSTQSRSVTLSVNFKPQGLSGGAIAGIVIGVLAGIGLAVGLFVFWQKKVRH